MLLDDWNEKLKSLPPDAPEWDAIGKFLQQVRQLADEKLAQLANSEKALQEALTRLASECSEELGYFEIEPVTQWSAGICSSAQRQQVICVIQSGTHSGNQKGQSLGDSNGNVRCLRPRFASLRR